MSTAVLVVLGLVAGVVMGVVFAGLAILAAVRYAVGRGLGW